MRLSRVFLVGVDILSAFQADGVYIIDITLLFNYTHFTHYHLYIVEELREYCGGC